MYKRGKIYSLSEETQTGRSIKRSELIARVTNFHIYMNFVLKHANQILK